MLIGHQSQYIFIYSTVKYGSLDSIIAQSPTSVVLTDRKRTVQILRAKTLRVFRQSKTLKKKIEIFFLVLILPKYSESAQKCCNF